MTIRLIRRALARLHVRHARGLEPTTTVTEPSWVGDSGPEMYVPAAAGCVVAGPRCLP